MLSTNVLESGEEDKKSPIKEKGIFGLKRARDFLALIILSIITYFYVTLPNHSVYPDRMFYNPDFLKEYLSWKVRCGDDKGFRRSVEKADDIFCID